LTFVPSVAVLTGTLERSPVCVLVLNPANLKVFTVVARTIREQGITGHYNKGNDNCSIAWFILLAGSGIQASPA